MTPSKILQAILGTIVTVGFMLASYLVLTQLVPAENKDIAVYMLGQLAGAFLTVIAFSFGSSVGSQRKDETVYQRKAPPA